MIFTKVDALVKDIDVDKYHIETVILSSDDLNKKIIRVKSDHGNEFGIRLDKGQKLQNGSAFFMAPSPLLGELALKRLFQHRLTVDLQLFLCGLQFRHAGVQLGK